MVPNPYAGGAASGPPPASSTGGSPHRIRVLVVDDHTVIRDGLRTLLDSSNDFEWVGEAIDGAEAVIEIARTLPEVVLMDLSMPGVDGVTATARIARDTPHVRVLVLTSFTEGQHVRSALAAGAVGVLSKDGDPATVLDGIRAAYARGLG